MQRETRQGRNEPSVVWCIISFTCPSSLHLGEESGQVGTGSLQPGEGGIMEGGMRGSGKKGNIKKRVEWKKVTEARIHRGEEEKKEVEEEAEEEVEGSMKRMEGGRR